MALVRNRDLAVAVRTARSISRRDPLFPIDGEPIHNSRIGIPSTKTVYVLSGAFGDPSTMTLEVRGQITVDADNIIPLQFNSFAYGDAAVISGRDQLDAVLEAGIRTGPQIVFGYGLGAVIACRWLSDLAPNSPVLPSEVSFVLIGNPARRYGGKAAYYGTAVPPPVNTKYIVLDVARQYDGAADWPQVPDTIAFANAKAGLLALHQPNLDGVGGYHSVGLGDPGAVWTEGNITYQVIRTDVLPLLGDDAARQDKALRPQVEASYRRGAPVDLPDYDY